MKILRISSKFSTSNPSRIWWKLFPSSPTLITSVESQLLFEKSTLMSSLFLTHNQRHFLKFPLPSFNDFSLSLEWSKNKSYHDPQDPNNLEPLQTHPEPNSSFQFATIQWYRPTMKKIKGKEITESFKGRYLPLIYVMLFDIFCSVLFHFLKCQLWSTKLILYS